MTHTKQQQDHVMCLYSHFSPENESSPPTVTSYSLPDWHALFRWISEKRRLESPTPPPLVALLISHCLFVLLALMSPSLPVSLSLPHSPLPLSIDDGSYFHIPPLYISLAIYRQSKSRNIKSKALNRLLARFCYDCQSTRAAEKRERVRESLFTTTIEHHTHVLSHSLPNSRYGCPFPFSDSLPCPILALDSSTFPPFSLTHGCQAI